MRAAPLRLLILRYLLLLQCVTDSRWRVVLLKLCFAALKDPRVILPLLADPWMLLEILLEGWMLLEILLVGNEVGILPQLLGNCRMAVEEPICAGSLSAGD